MSGLEEIEQAIDRLPPEDIERVAQWLRERESRRHNEDLSVRPWSFYISGHAEGRSAFGGAGGFACQTPLLHGQFTNPADTG